MGWDGMIVGGVGDVVRPVQQSAEPAKAIFWGTSGSLWHCVSQHTEKLLFFSNFVKK